MRSDRMIHWAVRWLAILTLATASLGAGVVTGPSAVAAAAPQLAGQTCTVLQPGPVAAFDAYIKQDSPDSRLGGDNELRVKTESGKLNRSLLRFDLSVIPADAIVTSATLSLWVKEVKDGNVTISARRVTASWNEAQVTWKARDKAANLLWTAQGGDYSATALDTEPFVKDVKNYWAAWDVTAAAANWVSNPAANYGVILESPVTSPKNETKFKSSDDGTASQRPKLEVCYSAGVTVEPDNSDEGVSGTTKTYAHVVTVGNLTTAVSLSAGSSKGWTTRVYRDVNGNGVKDPEDTLITQTPVIGPNVTYPILVQVDIPPGATLGAIDTTTVTATAVATGRFDTAADVTRVGQLLSVQPDNSAYATAGSVVFYGHWIKNNGDTQDCVTVTATSSQGWTVLLWQDLNQNGVHETSNPAEPALTNPVCINPGGVYYLVAEVRVGAGAAAGAVDRTVVAARSGNEPSKSDSATDTTTVFVNNPPVVDGQYDDIYRISPDAQQVCYNANGVLFGKLATFYQPTSNAVYMVLAIDKDFVDNTYGTNAVGWPSGHTFGNLDGSDHAQFYGYDANGALVLDFKLDYIDAKSGTPSGYASLGVSGGEGKVNVGSAAHIQQWGSSLAYSLNATGYCAGGNCNLAGTDLKVNSPATDEFYTANPTYPNWIYDVIYEVKIDKAAFGAAGFGSLEVPYIHASPSKLGTNTIYAEPGVCPGEIGDLVWHDQNHDGIQDGGEPGIDGVQVKLYRDDGDRLFDPAKDTVVGTQTTRSGGKYLFQNVAPGDFFVDVVDATVPAGYVSTTNNDPTPVFNLDPGERYLDADFGYSPAYGELAISKTLTSAQPTYMGQEISYTIRITNTGTTLVTFLPLEDYYDTSKVDFLAATPATNDNLDDGVLNWSDLTASFGRDLAPGQAFAVVVRFRATQATTTTLLAAAASVAGLQAEPVVDGLLDSNYQFQQYFAYPANDAPANLYAYAGASMCYWALVVDRSFNDNVYSETFGAYLSLDGWTQAHKFSNLTGSDNVVFNITYTGGSYSNVTLDYLNGVPGAWSSGQTTKDGSSAPGTPPIADAMTSLHWNMENSGWTSLTQSPPYNYNQTSGKYWEWAMIYEFSIPKSRMGGACGNVTLASAHNSPTKDKGMASIGDRVWGDADEDGVQDPGETGLPNVVVNLYQGATLVRTTHTEPGTSGYYIFNNLAAGTYTVVVDQTTVPTDYVLTTNNQPLTVALNSGQKYTAADFGYWLHGTASIGDRVFYDLNGDGLPDDDGEPGINGVRVNLFSGACGTGGALKKTMLTAGDGDYDFTRLAAGVYCVDVDNSTVPSGYGLTTANEPATVTVNDGQDYNLADFGYRATCPPGAIPNLAQARGALDDTGATVATVRSYVCSEIKPAPGSIGDTVWNDANGNGVQDLYDSNNDGIPDTSEPGITGAVVKLTWFNGTVVTATTTITGYYRFDLLPAGVYTVDVISIAAGYYPTTSNHPQTVNLGFAQNYTDADFGYAGKGPITGVVFYDWNKDGQQGPNEQGIGDVEVCLFRDTNWDGHLDGGDVFIGCTRTNSDGGYVFPDQIAGRYLVVQTQPAGLENTTPNTRPLSLVIVGPGGSSDNNNFGEIVYVKLGGFAYLDADGDGVRDPGEDTGLYNVPIQVTGSDVSGNSVNTTKTTVAGDYLASGLLPGTYTVSAPSVANGYQRTSQSPLTTTLTVVITQDLTLDFGYAYPTIVTIQRFEASAARGAAILEWEVVGLPAQGFHVWRADNNKAAGAVRVTPAALPPTADGRYRFVDSTVQAGQTYWYWLEEVATAQQFGPRSVTLPRNAGRVFLPMVGASSPVNHAAAALAHDATGAFLSLIGE